MGQRWDVNMDLEKFSKHVDYDVLMSRLARQIDDSHIRKLIRSYLLAGIMEGGVVSQSSEGTPQVEGDCGAVKRLKNRLREELSCTIRRQTTTQYTLEEQLDIEQLF